MVSTSRETCSIQIVVKPDRRRSELYFNNILLELSVGYIVYSSKWVD